MISGSIKAGDLRDSQVVRTLNGLSVTIVKRNGAVYVNDAMVVTPDVIGSNGVVHIVDKVIFPPAASVVQPPPTTVNCGSDTQAMCASWASQGYCTGAAQAWMLQNCARSCNPSCASSTAFTVVG